MKIIKRIALGLVLVVALIVIGFVAWAETPLGPSPEAITALQSDANVTVTTDNFITFQPVNLKPSTAFIFYPGGRVDYRSYAAPLRAIAEQGYLVVLVPVSLNMAFFDINAAEPVFAAHPEITRWVVGGHSLGGVAASLFAGKHSEVSGLVFWASYPADDSIKDSDLRVLSIYGTKDMAGMSKFDETASLNPADTQYVVIDGGNHAQFGNYGAQPGDNEATISRAEQQSQIVEAVVSFLASFLK